MLKTHIGDCRRILPTIEGESVQSCVTSPPYFGLRNYGESDQIGLEATVEEYVETMVEVFREVKRILKDDGTLWLNLGDTYLSNPSNNQVPQTKDHKGSGHNGSNRKPQLGLKPKDLIGIPWRVAFALQADGWYLRQDIIWNKPNPMPESVRDRCTKSHEYIFLLSKSPRYYFDQEGISEPCTYGHEAKYDNGMNGHHSAVSSQGNGNSTRKFKKSGNKERKTGQERGCPEGTGSNVWEGLTRNKRSVWTVSTKPFNDAHFAVYPPELILPCILAGSKPGDTILDPFGGSGTTGKVAIENGRKAVLIELNPEYGKLIDQRTTTTVGLGI